MNKLISILISLGLVLTVGLWLGPIEFSGIGTGLLCGALLPTLFYLLDRYGFRHVDTIEYLRFHASSSTYAKPGVVLGYMALYALLTSVGFWAGYVGGN